MHAKSERSTSAEGAAFCRALGALERGHGLTNPDDLAHHILYAASVAHPERFEGAALQAAFSAARGEPFTFGLDPDPAALDVFLFARGLERVACWNQTELRALYPGPGFLMPYVGAVHARVPPVR
ncbi:MAG TPA: hypothetical protein VHV30_03315 [Polyangiaceae bacterium]|nr:hypothetical protein [Polyangiaceae bacterium]